MNRKLLILLFFIILSGGYILFLLINSSTKNQEYLINKNNTFIPATSTIVTEAEIVKNDNSSTSEVADPSWISVNDFYTSHQNVATYKILNGSVYYSKETSAGKNTYQPLLQADLPSLLVYKDDDKYAKDKNNVYVRGEIISICYSNPCTQQKQIDPVSLKILPRPYLKDAYGVYYDINDNNQSMNRNYTTLKEADPVTFISFISSNRMYAKDSKFVWFNHQKIVGANAETFSASEYYGKDKLHVYQGGSIIPNADPSTFEDLRQDAYAKDSQRVYYNGEIIPEADVKTFGVFGFEYFKDKDHVYYLGKVIPSAKPETFELPTSF